MIGGLDGTITTGRSAVIPSAVRHSSALHGVVSRYPLYLHGGTITSVFLPQPGVLRGATVSRCVSHNMTANSRYSESITLADLRPSENCAQLIYVVLMLVYASVFCALNRSRRRNRRLWSHLSRALFMTVMPINRSECRLPAAVLYWPISISRAAAPG